MKKIFTICGLFFGMFFAYGSETNIINIAALAACGTGVTNGWTVSGIDSYHDRTSIRLNTKDDFLLSPTFDAPIVAVLFMVKSSYQTGRRLTVLPMFNGDYIYEPSLTCDYSKNDDTYVPRSVIIPENKNITGFKLALENNGDGNKAAWGISELSVVTATPTHLSPPENVIVRHIQPTSAKIRWDDNTFIASNLVTISEITEQTDQHTVIRDYDFGLCVNTLTNDTQDKSADVNAKYPDLSGEKLYYPASSSGVIRMSTEKTNGRLTHCGFPDYAGMSVEISAKRYPGDKTCEKLFVYYHHVYDGQSSYPMEIGSFDISDEYTVGCIPLDNAPGNVAISIGNLDGYKSNRRYLIDRITFIKDTPSTTTTTNSVLTAVTSGATVFQADGLSRETKYVVRVAAIDDKGRISEASTPVVFTTTGKSVGTYLFIR